MMFKTSRTASLIAFAAILSACSPPVPAPTAAAPALSTEASTAAADIVNAATLTPKPLVAEAIDLMAAIVAQDSVAGRGKTMPLARYLGDQLIAGGFAPEDIVVGEADGEGYLIATYKGTTDARPILISDHIDVVEAFDKDWERPPFKPIVENGYMFGRGIADVKFDVAVVVVTLKRLKAEGFKPATDIVLTLSGDEETEMVTTEKLADLYKDASLVLNGDGGGGLMGEDDKPVAFFIQGAEKSYADYRVTFTNPGGHSSEPRADNAIYHLADAIKKIEAYKFPRQVNEITREYLKALAPQTGGAVGEAMRRFADNPNDKAAGDLLASYPDHVGTIGTTCVATMLNGGHALNALPQSANVDVNCRIFPGTSPEDVRKALETAIANPAAKVERLEQTPSSDASPLREDVMAALRKAVDRRYPGLPIIPEMSAGASDSLYFRAHGIPSYGVGSLFMKVSDDFSHGLNERVDLRSVDGALDQWKTMLTELAGKPAP